MFLFEEKVSGYKPLLIMLFLTLVVVVANAFELPHIHPFNYTQMLTNYEDEFLKRGGIGEVFRIAGVSISYQVADLFSYLLFFLVVLVYVVFVVIPFKDVFDWSGSLLFVFLAILHSATLQHYYLDVGRSDGLEFLFLVLAIVMINKLPAILSYLLVPVVIFCMLLIHEGSFFIFLPILLSYWIYRHFTKKNMAVVALIGLLTLFATYQISIQGKSDKLSKTERYSHLVSIYGAEHINRNAITVLYRGLGDNVSNTLLKGVTLKRFYYHLMMLAVLLPLFILFGLLFLEIYRKTGVSIEIILMLSAFTPLILYPIGHDHFRWWALAITNFFIVLSLISYHDKSLRKVIIDLLYRYQYLVVICIVSSILLGGMGATNPFPVVLDPENFVE